MSTTTNSTERPDFNTVAAQRGWHRPAKFNTDNPSVAAKLGSEPVEVKLVSGNEIHRAVWGCGGSKLQPQDVEDIAQSVLMSLWDSWDRLPEFDDFNQGIRSWMVTIVRRRVADFDRAESRRANLHHGEDGGEWERRVELWDPTPGTDAFTPQPPSEDPLQRKSDVSQQMPTVDGPEALIDSDEVSIRHAVRQALKRLSPVRRDVLTMLYFEEFSVAEVMVKLDMSEASVHAAASRGRNDLRAILRDWADDNRMLDDGTSAGVLGSLWRGVECRVGWINHEIV